MPGGGRLTVATGRGRVDRAAAERLGLAGAGPVARLEVSDEGTGIDEEARRHLFEPFFSTRRTRRTAGMGLAIVYACVKELGGAVEVESGSASGATIRLHLPPADGPRPRERARPDDPSASAPTT
jgi:signal transduction histidine kinase